MSSWTLSRGGGECREAKAFGPSPMGVRDSVLVLGFGELVMNKIKIPLPAKLTRETDGLVNVKFSAIKRGHGRIFRRSFG